MSYPSTAPFSVTSSRPRFPRARITFEILGDLISESAIFLDVVDTIKPESLAWALTHVRRHGDTDIFPVPFEYEAIAHDWNAIEPHPS